MTSTRGEESIINVDGHDDKSYTIFKRFSDPKALSALSPVAITVIYIAIVLIAVLLVLVALWITTACCEHERAKRLRARRGMYVRRHACDPTYGSTACLSTVTTTTSIDNESEHRMTPATSAPIRNGTRSPTECCACSKSDITTLGREVTLISKHCNRCERKLRSADLPVRCRKQLFVKRRPTERSHLLRNGSLYHPKSVQSNKHVQRSSSHCHAENHYRQHHLPKSVSTLCVDHSPESGYFSNRHMIPRAKYHSSTTLQKSQERTSSPQAVEPYLSLSTNSIAATTRVDSNASLTRVPTPPPLTEPVVGLSLDRRPLHLETAPLQM